MASSGPLASLYFIALMTIGNYVLFNLLVAILVEGFQAEVRTHWKRHKSNTHPHKAHMKMQAGQKVFRDITAKNFHRFIMNALVKIDV